MALDLLKRPIARLQDVLCNAEPCPHEGTGADGEGHIVVELDVYSENQHIVKFSASAVDSPIASTVAPPNPSTNALNQRPNGFPKTSILPHPFPRSAPAKSRNQNPASPACGCHPACRPFHQNPRQIPNPTRAAAR